MDRVLSVFVALTRWGAENGVPYSRPEAVREYMRRVAEAFPEHYHDAMTVADLFCEARFSTHLMESVRIRNYIQAARKISKSSG